MTARKNLDSKEIYEAFLAADRNKAEAARRLGITPASVTLHVEKIEGVEIRTQSTEAQLRAAREQIKSLESRLVTDGFVRETIFKIASTEVSPPDWLTKPKKGHSSQFAGVPTLFASDWHFAEVVKPSEIGHVNEYNIAIARERVRTFITVAIDLLRNKLSSGEYPGVILALGGDMISGDIHEELSETNEIPTLPAVLELSSIIAWAVETLANEFGAVFVPCVTGNHGRLSRKPRAKRRNYTNFDWLLYQILAKRFENDRRITFYIPDGPDAYYRVYNVRYLLTHGDQFRGGDGMIGALGPISRGDKKKRARNGQIDRSFDVMLLGHWHQYIHLTRFIVNGSLKGYDEYADANNFDVEPAQQAMWITHPDHGVTFRMPIYVQRTEKGPKTEWVTLPEKI